MTTIPARLAKATSTVSSWDEARRASLSAYRTWYRSAPDIVQLYGLHVSPSLVRMKIRQDFERNRDTITDLSVMNVMLLKNHQEYQETMNLWKQEPHVMHWFKKYDNPPQPKTFLEKFYAGRDEPSQLEPTY
ncbi:NADH dehydrogenase (ubiquinone) 1 alpha subcomplex 6 [Cryptococcus neoformans]|uniref:NADH dehydrogenase (Ubiquinone) 1 alpha subcomplex 6 n=1 Tax=Cryptococcus neoformans Tu259-1 TaxID=1230072 RepID=A0A854QM66_CRYNE|nr:NADH dehydrogenase (ubiquinone) 1 alpha subcomplex 6 [Cryptococcus neoformans var. grubii 125.91]OXG28934.1 NADH dehydrogenase (ubiquinone) 1 alpha subcomplex 6 [Cryptococcus neoformans var. grubii Tu259-1]OXG45518.1 NADH dehydrogenase (ubiquinone) 1 alpha subcomplex 6 [Cryptococcus neoformans var. grubii Bt120]OXG54185.1 NADH dehydrogenase (ubiquinone) 1 alpha subcomplex 6 [Cryptococcus neoformans var. grubii Th84]OXG88607.1 NADH dehydrogenase (ubiquinone) 1 alpha subcomplex 6 [Cryptococcus